jgi:hypothetical protein
LLSFTGTIPENLNNVGYRRTLLSFCTTVMQNLNNVGGGTHVVELLQDR